MSGPGLVVLPQMALALLGKRLEGNPLQESLGEPTPKFLIH